MNKIYPFYNYRIFDYIAPKYVGSCPTTAIEIIIRNVLYHKSRGRLISFVNDANSRLKRIFRDGNRATMSILLYSLSKSLIVRMKTFVWLTKSYFSRFHFPSREAQELRIQTNVDRLILSLHNSRISRGKFNYWIFRPCWLLANLNLI